MGVEPSFDDGIPPDERVLVQDRVEEATQCPDSKGADDDGDREPDTEL